MCLRQQPNFVQRIPPLAVYRVQEKHPHITNPQIPKHNPQYIQVIWPTKTRGFLLEGGHLRRKEGCMVLVPKYCHIFSLSDSHRDTNLIWILDVWAKLQPWGEYDTIETKIMPNQKHILSTIYGGISASKRSSLSISSKSGFLSYQNKSDGN